MDDSPTLLTVALPDSPTNPPTSCQDEMETWMDDTSIDSNACKDVTKEKTFDFQPVSPNSSGEGLPYAPEGWPNPGDVWCWRVAVRKNSAGYFTEREIILPRSLQNNPRRTVTLRSKAEIRRYLQSNFPDMKIEVFLALFSWKVPAIVQTPTKAIKLLQAGEDATEEIDTQITLKRKREAAVAQLANLSDRKYKATITQLGNFPVRLRFVPI